MESKKCVLQTLQIRIKALAFELATIQKIIELSSCPKNCNGCSLGEVEATELSGCPKGCPNKPCGDGCSLGETETIEVSGCPKNCPNHPCGDGCSLGESEKVELCDNKNCPNGCSLGEVENAKLSSCPKNCDGCSLGEVETTELSGCPKGCPNKPCGDGCSLGETETIEMSGCPKNCPNHPCGDGCSLGESEQIELCDNKNCPNGCSLGETEQSEYAQKKTSNDGVAFSGGDDDGTDDDCECGCQDDCDCGCCGGHDEPVAGSAEYYLNLAKQVKADFDNYRRRNNDAIGVATIEGAKSAICEFLPILDTVNTAVSLVTDENAKHGLELIKNSIETTLARLGVEPIEALNKHYDPNFHNVVLSEDSDAESGTIIEELEKGYTYKGAVIKHSVVKIAK